MQKVLHKNDNVQGPTAAEGNTSLDHIKQQLEQRPGFLLRRCLQHTSGIFEDSCAHVGITARQYDYLFVLNMVPELGQGEIAEALGLDRSTNTLVLKILERKQFIEREIVANDTRRRMVRITDSGRTAYRSANAAAKNAIKSISDTLKPDEYALLIALLQKIVKGNAENLKGSTI